MRSNESFNPGSFYKPKEDLMGKYRNTALKSEDRGSDLYILRKSCSTNSLRYINTPEVNELRFTNLAQEKRKSFQTLKSTLDLLEDKVNLVKEELQLPLSSTNKKNKYILDIDEKDQYENQHDLRSPTDSSITQKTAQKKFSSYLTTPQKQKNLKSFNINPYSPRRHSIYYVSQSIRAINQKNSLALEHVNSSIKMIKACQSYEIPLLPEIEGRKVTLKKHEKYKNKKTLILDLDETLIHCVENPDNQADMKLQIKVDGTPIQIGINIRPYALTFLKKMATKYQIIIFTASHHSYADTILDELDPDGEIFQHRLYRQHCYVLENELHVKDLRILNRNLSQTVLVDNAAYSYAFQLENGIPILPFYEGTDYELAALEGYLDEIERALDVRQFNKKTFKLHHYSKFFGPEELIEQLYMNNFN